MRRISVNENDPAYCPWLLGGLNDDMGDIKIYLKDAPDAKIYFETVDQEKREAVIFVYGHDGERVILGDNSLKTILTDVDIVIEMTDARREEIEYWFAIEEKKD